MIVSPSDAHRSGCHRWHSCPSDTGSYICGGLGYSKYCGTTPKAADKKATTPSRSDTSAQPVPYKRSLYRLWIDADKDCQDTRQEVLIEESLVTVTYKTARRCKVASGRWYDPYTGRTFRNPSDLDIDHMVPLAEAHESGASRWSASRRTAYANDLDHPESLIAVSSSANRSKGRKDPAKWMPPNKAYWCDYVKAWRSVKARWGLSMDPSEAMAVNRVLRTCAQ